MDARPAHPLAQAAEILVLVLKRPYGSFQGCECERSWTPDDGGQRQYARPAGAHSHVQALVQRGCTSLPPVKNANRNSTFNQTHGNIIRVFAICQYLIANNYQN
jgi:hypothetical protein